MAIDDEALINVLPLAAALLAELTLVSRWVLDIDIPAWLSLPDRLVLILISHGILITNVFRAHCLVESHMPLPGPDLHPRQPDNLILRLLHRLWPIHVPPSKLRSLSIDFHDLLSFIKRVVDIKVDCVFLPRMVV